MGNSAVDYLALVIGVVIAAVIATTLVAADRTRDVRRLWIAGGVLALVLSVLGFVDLMAASPRETPAVTAVIASLVTVLSAIGVTRMARGVRTWLRWLLVSLAAFVLLYGSLLLGVTLIARVGA